MFILIFLFLFSAVYANEVNQDVSFFKFLKPEYKNIEFVKESGNFLSENELTALNECITDYKHFIQKKQEYKISYYLYKFIRTKEKHYILFYIGFDNELIIKKGLDVNMGGHAYYLYNLKEKKIQIRQYMR